MNQTNQVFIVTLSIIVLGFLLKKYNFVTEKEGKVVSKFLMYTTFPALMFVSTVNVKLDTTLLLIPFLGILFCSTMILIAWFLFAKYPNDLRGVFTMGAGVLNTGLFGFPIIEGLFGKDALVYAVMFDIGNTFVAFGIVYSIGTYFSSNKKEQISFQQILKKVFSLPPVLGMILGLFINISKIQLPTFFLESMNVLAIANKSLVLLLMGVYLSFELNKRQMLDISKVLLIRYSMGFLAILTLFYFLPDSVMRDVLIICVILPLGMTILPFSDEMNYDSRIAGTLLNISLLISFILMWGLVIGLNMGR